MSSGFDARNSNTPASTNKKLRPAEFMAVQRKRNLLRVLYESFEVCTGAFWCAVVFMFVKRVKQQVWVDLVLRRLWEIKGKIA